MSRDSVEIDEYLGRFYLVWHVDGEVGAYVGEAGLGPLARAAKLEEAQKEENQEEVEYWAVEVAVAATPGVQGDEYGFFWEFMAGATDALRHARAVLKMERLRFKNKENPWPPWALEAKAAGWKPPKNWKP